jgi:hypothetical protein
VVSSTSDDSEPEPAQQAPPPSAAPEQQPSKKRTAAHRPVTRSTNDDNTPQKKKKSRPDAATTVATSSLHHPMMDHFLLEELVQAPPNYLRVSGRWIIRSDELERSGFDRPLSLLVRHAESSQDGRRRRGGGGGGGHGQDGAFKACLSLGLLDGCLVPVPGRAVTAAMAPDGRCFTSHARIQW